MIQYTQKQLLEISQIISSNSKVPYVIVKAFMDPDFDLVTNKVKIDSSNKGIYERIKNLFSKKLNGNRPDKELKEKIWKVKFILFEAEKKDLPLYINDDIVISLVKWRLSNNI